MKAWLDNAWIGTALGIFAGAVIVLGYDAIDSRKSSLPAPSVPDPTVPPAPRDKPPSQAAEAAEQPAQAAEQPANVTERSPLPASLQMALDRDPGSRIAQFHAQMAHEARDPAWAPETEYRLQVALHDAAPKLLGRMQLETTCVSSMCEMLGLIKSADPAQASRDSSELQRVLDRMLASDAWIATDLGRPVASLVTSNSEGGRLFMVEFPKKRLAAR